MPPLPPSDPRAPHYWMHEESGVLRPVVQAYLAGEQLSPEQCGIMRAYLKQWIYSPVWDSNPYAGNDEKDELAGLRDGIKSLTNRAQIDTWLARAVSCAIDPL